MKKFKYLTFKVIFPTLLFICLVVFLSIFLFGGLKKHTTVYALDEFDNTLEGFIDYYEYSTAEKSAELTKKVVSQNNKYIMVFDESTTIISVYNKDGFNLDDLNNSKLLYSTAMQNGNGEQRANLIFTYIDENGKTGTINSYDKSVQYQNATTGTYERHYKVKYIPEENTIDIYYEIGDFAPYVFPSQINYADFRDMFIGNAIFRADTKNQFEKVTIYDENGEEVKTTKSNTKGSYEADYGLALTYTYLVVIDVEAAKYIVENDLATLNGKADLSKEQAIEYIETSNSPYFLFDNLYDENGKLKLKLGVNYNCEGSPVQVNPFNYYQMIESDINGIYEFKYAIEETKGGTTAVNEYTKKWPNDLAQLSEVKDAFYKYASLTLLQKTKLYNFLYVGNYKVDEEGNINYDKHQYTYEISDETGKDYFYPVYFDYNGDGVYTEDEYFQYGGFPLKNEDGTYVYETDSEGNILRCKQSAYTTELANAANDKYGNVDTTSKIVYSACLRFTLQNDGLDVTLLHNSIDESSSQGTKLYTAEICKYMTYIQYASGKEEAGEIIIPDGSGAVIQFNSPKGAQYASKYPEKRIYGNDGAINVLERGNSTENIMLSMYGFIESVKGRGVVAIIDEGSAQNSINADIQRTNTTYNYCYFKCYLREIEQVKVTSSNSYIKSTNELYQGDIKYCYKFLNGSELDYVDVANTYRKYLVNKYDLFEEDETLESNPTFTFLGAYEKKALKAGIVKLREYSITTFSQAMDIVRELRNNGITQMNVSYRSWTEDDNDQKTTTKINVSNVLGDSSALKKLADYLNSNNIDFYPEYKVSVGKGYDLMFGNLKYNSKSISGSYSNALSFVLSTGLENKDSKRGQYVSPIYYNNLISKYLKNYSRFDINGLYVSDLGNSNIADYSKKTQLYSAGGTSEQQDALSVIRQNNTKVMLRSPFDYAFSYCNVATCIPVTSTLYGIVDYSIPLYQLVASGLFDYSSNPINYNNDYSLTWNLLKDIETGSNPAFVICADDTNVLLDTQYTDYYNCYYVNWKDSISYVIKTLNETGIYNSKLVNHEYLTDNVVRVTYQNGLQIIINYDNENYYDTQSGLVVASNWFAIMSKGGN